jgi:hypothetical protein
MHGRTCLHTVERNHLYRRDLRCLTRRPSGPKTPARRRPPVCYGKPPRRRDPPTGAVSDPGVAPTRVASRGRGTDSGSLGG